MTTISATRAEHQNTRGRLGLLGRLGRRSRLGRRRITGGATGAARHEGAILAAVAVLAAVLYGWQAAHAQYHGFYATAVRSMTMNWRAFVYGALDPRASITIDKIPGFLWPQALSAKVFGFHPWALALPQAVEGVVTVVALQRTVRRWAGPGAGLLAAGIMTLTPVAASLFGKTLEDAALTCALTLAAYFWQRSVEAGRLRMLLLCGVFVGLGFQAKMLQAWAVLPAFAVAYLVAAPPSLRKRVAHVAAAGAVCAAVSLSWILLVSITPSADRPYVDGSTTNSATAMVFGYNGLARFSQVGLNAAGTGSVSATQGAMGGGGSGGGGGRGGGAVGGPGGGSRVAGGGGGSDLTGWAKLVRPGLASQVGWLYPLAAIGCALGLARRRRGRTDAIRAGTLMWGGWFAVTALALSAGSVAHSTYVVALAPPVAALSALALIRAAATYRAPLAATRAGRLRAALLPGLVLVNGLWAIRLARAYPGFAGGLALPFAAVAAVAVTVLLLARFATAVSARTAAVCCAVAGAVLLAQPAVWSLSVLDSRYDGSSGNASAGAYQGGFGAGPVASAGRGGHGADANADAGPGGAVSGEGEGFSGGAFAGAGGFNPFDPSGVLSTAQTRLLDYVTAHRDGAEYLLATQSWAAASPYILDDGAAVLPMGGFSGRADFPTPPQFHSWVRSGAVRYVLLVGMGMRGFGAAQPSPMQPVGSVGSTGSAGSTGLSGPLGSMTGSTGSTGPITAAGSTAGSTAGHGAAATNEAPTDADRIATAVKRHCTLVPAARYGGVPMVTEPLYACGEAGKAKQA